MSKPPKTYRRRTVLIDRDFQLSFILRFAGLLVFYFLLFLVISMVAPVGISLLGGAADWAMMETAFRVDVLLRMVLAPLVCTFICLFTHGLMETFRIAGPNYRFRMVFKDLARGRIPRGVRIRHTDYLQESCQEFSGALESLHDRLAALKRQQHELEQFLGPDAVNASLRRSVLGMGRLLEEFELLTFAPACEPIPPQEVLAQEPMQSECGGVEGLVGADAGLATALQAGTHEPGN